MAADSLHFPLAAGARELQIRGLLFLSDVPKVSYIFSRRVKFSPDKIAVPGATPSRAAFAFRQPSPFPAAATGTGTAWGAPWGHPGDTLGVPWGYPGGIWGVPEGQHPPAPPGTGQGPRPPSGGWIRNPPRQARLFITLFWHACH